MAAVAVGGLAAGPALARLAPPGERAVSFYNTHTGETVRLVYWAPGDGYLRQSLKEISWALRDHRTDEVMAIDPQLIDLMHALQVKMGRRPLDVLSGYRSQE
ncbi:MAG: DUF882 domain-containing protein, partial [Pseudomonadota bacterium]|nr:DUF882 domain-containing protein [Pseudomonadota bacterium]